MNSKRPNFSRAGFVLATVGSAIGLGNIWKFPYITYENGGGSFVIIYLIAVTLIGAPLMMAEIFIGRHSRKNVVDAFSDSSKKSKISPIWKGVGWLSLLGLFLLTYYYSVAGWVLYYIKETIGWSIHGFHMDSAALGTEFKSFLTDGPMQLACTVFFLAITAFILSFGLTKGVERMSKILMPLLFFCLVVFIVAVSGLPGFGESFRFLFHFDHITSAAILEAIGHSFFTLSLGAGMAITFGSYLSNEQSIIRSTALVVFFDTLVGLMSCIIMYSIIFSVPEAERAATFSESAIILFTSLPKMLYALPGGVVVAPLFYLAVGFAALTSTLAMGEVFITFLHEKFSFARKKSTAIFLILSLLLAVPISLSNGAVYGLSNWAPLGSKHTGVFAVVDYLVSNWMLVLAGLFTALYVGWAFPAKPLREEIQEGHGSWKLYPIWRFAMRFILPAGILWILISVIQDF